MIDAHIHVFPDYTYEHHLALSQPQGVRRTLLIQAGANRFDNSYMLAVVRAFPKTFSAVVIVDHDSPTLATTIQDLHRQGARGFRIAARPDQPWLDSPGMNRLWSLAATHRMAICPLINPNAFPWVDAMARRHPNTTVVLDHFGRVGATGTIVPAELTALANLAKLPNLHVKISAFYALGRKQPPYTDLVPMIRQLVDAFSPQRLMWGSDAPYQTRAPHSYKASTDLIKSLPFLSPTARTALTESTAARIFF